MGEGSKIRSIAELSGRAKAIVMLGTLLGMFTSAMDQTIVATSLPRIVASLGGLGLFPWVFTSFMLVFTLSMPITGKLTDIYGRKPFYMGGIIFLLLGSALSGSAQSMEMLIAFRVIQGLGAGMIMGIAFAIVGDAFPPAQRAKWNGLLTAVFATASVAGPLIGGYLTDHVSWRWVFYVNLPMGSLALVILFFGMPSIKPARNKARFDYVGTVLLIAFVVPLLLALSWAGSRFDWLSVEVIALLITAAIIATIFTYSQRLAKDPLMPLHLFRNSIFTVSVIILFLSGFVLLGTFAFIPLFVQGVIGVTATNSGLIMMPMMICVVATSTVAGQIISRMGHYRILGIAGLSMMALGAGLLSQMGAGTSLLTVTLYMVILGLGLGTSLPLFLLVVQNAVPYSVMGIATSTVQFFRFVGSAAGVAVMGSIVNSSLASGLIKQTPVPVQQQVPPEILGALEDPQVLLSPGALENARQGFVDLDGGQGLFSQAVDGLRSALATAITDAFLLAMFVMVAAVAAAFFLREIPLHHGQFQSASPNDREAQDSKDSGQINSRVDDL